MKTIAETARKVLSGITHEMEMIRERKQIEERIVHDSSHLKQVDMEKLTAFQKKEVKNLSDSLFAVLGPDSRKFTIHKDTRYNDDAEVHFPMPRTGLTLSSTDMVRISKIKFFYINIQKDKIVVTFI